MCYHTRHATPALSTAFGVTVFPLILYGFRLQLHIQQSNFQGPSKDVLSASQDIANVISCACDDQAKGEESFKGLFELCQKSYEINGTEVSIQGHCSVQTQKEIITLAKLPKYFGGDLFFFIICQSVN